MDDGAIVKDYLSEEGMKGGRLVRGSERACSLLLYGMGLGVWGC
jgi:hypothetical protein